MTGRVTSPRDGGNGAALAARRLAAERAEAEKRRAEAEARRKAEEAARKAREAAERARAQAQAAAAEALRLRATAQKAAAHEALLKAMTLTERLNKAEQTANARAKELAKLDGVASPQLPYPMAEGFKRADVDGKLEPLPPEAEAQRAQLLATSLAQRRADQLQREALPPDTASVSLDSAAADFKERLAAELGPLLGPGERGKLDQCLRDSKKGFEDLQEILHPRALQPGMIDISPLRAYQPALRALQQQNPGAKLELVVKPSELGVDAPPLIRMTRGSESRTFSLDARLFIEPYRIGPIYAALLKEPALGEAFNRAYGAITGHAESDAQNTILAAGSSGATTSALLSMSQEDQAKLLQAIPANEAGTSLYGGLLQEVEPVQGLVSVDASGLARGETGGQVDATVDVRAADTGKTFHFLDEHANVLFAPEFQKYMLRGDPPAGVPRAGAYIENEIGIAMSMQADRSPGAPGEPLFTGEKAKVIAAIAEQIRAEAQGDSVAISVSPVMLNARDHGQVRLPLFKVQGKDGPRFIDNLGRRYSSFEDWKQNNQLPPGRMTYAQDGALRLGSDGQPLLETSNTPKTVDTWLEQGKQVADAVALVGGVVVLAAAVVGTGGAVVPIAGVALGLYGIGTSTANLADRSAHGQSISLTNSEAAMDWLNIAGSALALGSMSAATRAGTAVLGGGEKAAINGSRLMVASQYADTVAVGSQGMYLAEHWDEMDPQQRATFASQMAFFGIALSKQAHDVGGVRNLYDVNAAATNAFTLPSAGTVPTSSAVTPPVELPVAVVVPGRRRVNPDEPTSDGTTLEQIGTTAAGLPLGPERAAVFEREVLPILLADAQKTLGTKTDLSKLLARAVAGSGAQGLGLKETDSGLAADTDYPPRAANALWREYAQELGISQADVRAVRKLNAELGKLPKAEGKYAPDFEQLSPELKQVATRVSKSLLGEQVDPPLTSTEKAFKANLVLNNLTWHTTNWQRAAQDPTRAQALTRGNVFNTYSDNLAYAHERGGLPAVIDMAISDGYNAGKPDLGTLEMRRLPGSGETPVETRMEGGRLVRLTQRDLGDAPVDRTFVAPAPEPALAAPKPTLRPDGTFEPGTFPSGVKPPAALSALYTEGGSGPVIQRYADAAQQLGSSKLALAAAEQSEGAEAVAAARKQVAEAERELGASEWFVNAAYDDLVKLKTRNGAPFSTETSVASDAELSQWSGLGKEDLDALRAAPKGTVPLRVVEGFETAADAYRRALDDLAYGEHLLRQGGSPTELQQASQAISDAQERVKGGALTLAAKRDTLASAFTELTGREARNSTALDDAEILKSAFAEGWMRRASGPSVLAAGDRTLLELYDGVLDTTRPRYAPTRQDTGVPREQLANRLGLLADAEMAQTGTSLNDSFLTRLKEAGIRLRVSTAKGDNHLYQSAPLQPLDRKVGYHVWYDPVDKVIFVQDALLNGANGARKVPPGARFAQNPNPLDPTFLATPESAAPLLQVVHQALGEP